MVKTTTAERRAAVRAQRILSIQHRLIKSKNKDVVSPWYLSTTHDMSLTGVTFLSDVAYYVDDLLELQVVMSGVLDVVKGHGKVVRVEKKAMGAMYLVAVKFVKHGAKRKGGLTPNRLKARMK